MRIQDEFVVLMDAASELTEAGVCFYDLKEFFILDRKQFTMRHDMGHYCDFCIAARAMRDGRALCERSDRLEAVELARGYKEPFFHRCHMGLTELVTPLRWEQQLLGVVFFGQCRFAGETNHERILQHVHANGGDPEMFAQYLQRLPEVRSKELMAVGRLTQLSVEHLLLLHGEEVVHPQPLSISGSTFSRIKLYIDGNYMREISPGSICKTFFLNPSYLARLFHAQCGLTPTQYIIQVRLDKAKRLLQRTGLPVYEIAHNVGFRNANYFSRVFQHLEGCSPSEYRKYMDEGK